MTVFEIIKYTCIVCGILGIMFGVYDIFDSPTEATLKKFIFTSIAGFLFSFVFVFVIIALIGEFIL